MNSLFKELSLLNNILYSNDKEQFEDLIEKSKEMDNGM